MRIRFLKMWHRIPVGAVREIPDGQANLLIKRRLAEPSELEVAMIAPPETAMKRRAKPRYTRIAKVT